MGKRVKNWDSELNYHVLFFALRVESLGVIIFHNDNNHRMRVDTWQTEDYDYEEDDENKEIFLLFLR